MKKLEGLLDQVDDKNLNQRIRKIYKLLKSSFISREELVENNELFKNFLVRVAEYDNLESRILDFFIYSVFNNSFDFEACLDNPNVIDPRKTSTPFRIVNQIHNDFINNLNVDTLVDFGSGDGYLIWLSSILNKKLTYLGIEKLKENFEESQRLLDKIGKRKRILQRDFFDFEYESGNEAIAYAYDPFQHNDSSIVESFLKKLKSLHFKHIVLVEGYTQNFSENLQVLENYKVENKFLNYKDSNEERVRYAYCLSLI